MMLFAILFDFSMDYEVFLVSRIRQSFLRSGDLRSSVAEDLAVTARVITAAAAIMIFVFSRLFWVMIRSSRSSTSASLLLFWSMPRSSASF